ncbi:hypothetical protein ACOME3_004624 [Neoechinorhynchus agilis]
MIPESSSVVYVLDSNISSFEEWKNIRIRSFNDKQTTNGAQSMIPQNDSEFYSRHNHTATSHPDVTNVPQKNYASASCGSKIIEHSMDSKYVKNVLHDSPDTYMLCPRRSKMWFVVQLCEPIGAVSCSAHLFDHLTLIRITHIELGTLELFVNLPKVIELRVSNAKTYIPTRPNNRSAAIVVPVNQSANEPEIVHRKTYWDGQPILDVFACENERKVQRFSTNRSNLYVKYVRADILDTYGTEQNCALSSFRVFGTVFDEHIDAELESTETGDDVIGGLQAKGADLECSVLCQMSKRMSSGLLQRSINPLNDYHGYLQLLLTKPSYLSNSSLGHSSGSCAYFNRTSEDSSSKSNIPPLIRLNQKIQKLDKNVSLTNAYLEQLSQHYKSQIEALKTLLDCFNNLSGELYLKHSQETLSLINDINSSLRSVESKFTDDISRLYLSSKLLLFLIFCLFISIGATAMLGIAHVRRDHSVAIHEKHIHPYRLYPSRYLMIRRQRIKRSQPSRDMLTNGFRK